MTDLTLSQMMTEFEDLTNGDPFNITRVIDKKAKILSLLSSNPRLFTETIYKKGLLGRVQGSDIIDYDSDICNVTEESISLPKGIDIQPLGGKGKVGVPYILNVNRVRDTTNEKNLGLSITSLSALTNVRFGEKFILKKSTGISFGAFTSSKPLIDDKLFLSDLYKSCGYENVDLLTYIGLDEFLNETIIAYILEYIYDVKGLSSSGFNTYLKHYLGYICQGNGYNLMELADLGTLEGIGSNDSWNPYLERLKVFQGLDIVTVKIAKRETLVSILKQVIATLYFLQKTLNFNHNDCKNANIFVSSQRINVDFEGMVIDSPFTCKIGDYGKSSLTISLTEAAKPFRIFNYSKYASAYFYLSSQASNVVTINNELYYTLDDMSPLSINAYSRHTGLPFYKGFDVYTFILSLLMDPVFYYAFFSQDDLVRDIWDTMWVDDQKGLILNRLKESILKGDRGAYSSVLPLLKGLYFKCNILEESFEILKTK